MKDSVIQYAREGKEAGERWNRLREALHHIILQELDRQGFFKEACFVGGTALRVLFQLDRFSEDLDFSAAPQSTRFQFADHMAALGHALDAFDLSGKVEGLKKVKTVQSCFVTFSDLPYLAAASPRKNQKLAIKIDVDTRPPPGARDVVSVVTGLRVYKLRHYDLPSLFAGKMHALLFRQYLKGRDWFDFLWYVGKKVPVYRIFLQNAVYQTQGISCQFSVEELRGLLKKKIDGLDYKKLQQDLTPFLLDARSVNLFTPEVLQGAVAQLLVEEGLSSRYGNGSSLVE